MWSAGGGFWQLVQPWAAFRGSISAWYIWTLQSVHSPPPSGCLGTEKSGTDWDGAACFQVITATPALPPQSVLLGWLFKAAQPPPPPPYISAGKHSPRCHGSFFSIHKTVTGESSLQQHLPSQPWNPVVRSEKSLRPLHSPLRSWQVLMNTFFRKIVVWVRFKVLESEENLQLLFNFPHFQLVHHRTDPIGCIRCRFLFVIQTLRYEQQ